MSGFGKFCLKDMEKRVCIINFNTPELLHAAILSLWKCTPDCRVTVFDNSTITPCFSMDGVDVIDNTNGEIIDFEEFLNRFPNKQKTLNSWGSAKHCYTIQKLWDYVPNGFVLSDSDVLFKKDISDLFNPDIAYGGQIYVNPKRNNKKVPRLYPFLCWINVPECKKAGISYFDPQRNYKLTDSQDPYDLYDTGASFIEDCRNAALPGREFRVDEYILHFGSASFKTEQPWQEWLKEHENLYL